MVLSQNYGSFLNPKEKSEAIYTFNKPLIRLCCVSFFVFSLMALATVGTGLFYSMYTAPHPLVPASAYAKANAASSRVTKSLSTLREARPQNIDICNVISIVSEGVARNGERISIRDLNLKAQNYTIKGVGKDILSVNDFLKSLDFPSTKFDKQLTDIKSNPKLSVKPPMPGELPVASKPNEVPVEFTIQITPKATAKKTPARPPQAPKGGNP